MRISARFCTCRRRMKVSWASRRRSLADYAMLTAVPFPLINWSALDLAYADGGEQMPKTNELHELSERVDSMSDPDLEIALADIEFVTSQIKAKLAAKLAGSSSCETCHS